MGKNQIENHSFRPLGYTGKNSHKHGLEQAPYSVESVRICTISTPRMSVVGQIKLMNKALVPAYWA